jgi:hypothetical protein
MKHNHQGKLLAERTQDRPSRQRVSIMSALRYRAERFGAHCHGFVYLPRMKPFGNSTISVADEERWAPGSRPRP